MNSNTAFEVKAEAFRIMTGHLAPGKDAGLLDGDSISHQDRYEKWGIWVVVHGDVIRAMLKAVDNVLLSDEA